MSKANHIRKQWIDGDTADRITSISLTEYRDYLQKELELWKKNPRSESNPTGYWMHPEDVSGNILKIEALNLIIKDFPTITN
jgi:hypothetical protein